MLEKTPESPLDSEEVKPVKPKGNQSWIFIERTDAEAPILWSPDARSHLIRKDPDAGKDWGQKEKRATEDKMIELHRLNGHEFQQTLGDSEEQGSLAAAVHGVTKSWTQLSDWTTTTVLVTFYHVHYITSILYISGSLYLLTCCCCCCLVTNSCLTLQSHGLYSLSGSYVHGISQGRVLKLPVDLPYPEIEPVSPALAGGFFATEPSEKSNILTAFFQSPPPLICQFWYPQIWSLFLWVACLFLKYDWHITPC